MQNEPISMAQTVHLVEQAQRGDSRAVEALFRRYLPIVRQVAALRLGRRTSQLVEVEDIVQEALLEAFRCIDGFDVSQGRFCHWLSTVVENRIRMEARRGSAKKRGEGRVLRFADEDSNLRSSLFAGQEPTPSQNLARRELEERIQTSLLEMSERQREIIIQRMICEMSFEEITEQMGFDLASSARTLYSRALMELRRRVDEA